MDRISALDLVALVLDEDMGTDLVELVGIGKIGITEETERPQMLSGADILGRDRDTGRIATLLERGHGQALRRAGRQLRPDTMADVTAS